MRSVLAALTLYLLLVPAAPAAGPEDLLGEWLNQEKDARIELFPCGADYCGRVVWLKEPNYPEGSKDGAPGTPKLDHNNPSQELRKAPVIGLRIVNGMRYEGDGRWSGGTVYDPKNGRTYKGKMTLVSPRELRLRGYIGISLIGRTATWTREDRHGDTVTRGQGRESGQ